MVRGELSAEPAKPARVTLTVGGILRGAGRLLPIAIFVVPFGIAFGVASAEAAMEPLLAIVMSAITFSGAAQFATLDFLPGPIAFTSLMLVAFALNARHIIMGAALSPWVNRLPLAKRILALSFLSDPNFADTQPALRQGECDLGILVGGGMMLWAAWVTGTAAGAFGGAMIGDPAAYGVDVVMACFFAAAVIGMIAGTSDWKKTLLPVSAAAITSALTLAWLPAGWNIIAGAIVGGAVGGLRND